ncbi:hypothetical protein KBA41_06980 [Candidatus Ozemobacteraceae bacterium]|nr:hypothetical protein [Candidatus Ozemobacteraceae bacterium]
MTDPRDPRRTSDPDRSIEDMDALAREIDELARQRERIFQSLKPGAGPSASGLAERAERLEAENRQLKDRINALALVESSSGTLADRLRRTEELLDERTRELQQLRLQSASEAALLEEMRKQNTEIERLKARLADADKEKPDVAALQDELRRLKLNLADAILEQKQAGATNQDLLKQIFELKQEVFQHQSQVRDLDARLDVSKRNEQALSELEKQQKLELASLHTTVEESTRQLDRLQEQHKTISAEYEKAQGELEKARATVAEFRTAFTNLKSEYEAEKIQRQAAETREHEIVTTFDAINQERLQLKEKVSRLLVGVKDYITPPSRPASTTEDGALEPKEMRPYIPFCFPDRLPAQLRPHWKRTKRLPLVTPQGMLNTIRSDEFQRPIRKPLIQAYRFRELTCPPTSALPTEPYLHTFSRDFSIVEHPFEVSVAMARTTQPFPGPLRLAGIERRFPPRSLIIEFSEKMAVRPLDMSIYTTSAAMFFDYLASDIIAAFRNTMYRLEYRYPPDSPGKTEEFGPATKTISSGRVALHTTSHLQFALRYPVRTELPPRFPQDRLKYLLRTIGDSLSSMMARLDDTEPDDDSGPKPT